MPTSEQVQIDALRVDMTDGRRKIYEKVEGVEDRLSELKTEVHGLSVRADEREKRHDEWRAEIRGQLKDMSDGFIKAQRETASFNREVLDALRARGNGPTDPPTGTAPAAVPPPPRGPTFAEQLNALDWRWSAVIGLAVLALGGVLTASDASYIIRAAFAPPPAVATQGAPVAPVVPVEP